MNLIDIYGDIKPGDKILKQNIDQNGKVIGKPELIIVCAIDFWDQAPAVHYTKYKEFNAFCTLGYDIPKIYSFGEWMEGWLILGHWQMMPSFRRLIKSYRKNR